MNEIANLNHARKTRARAQKRVQADANAAKFGRTKAERISEAARSEQARRILDQHHMDEE